MNETPELDFVVTLYPGPILRKVAEPVRVVDDEVRRTIAAMFRRMVASKGVGLAAPQVGLQRRILVLNPTGDEQDALALVNPTIVSRSGFETILSEGCLSFPGIYADVRRLDRCTVSALDPQGKPIEQEYSGFVSRIIQHEYDHLEGILLVDRMSPADKLKNRAALEELVADYKRGSPSAAVRSR